MEIKHLRGHRITSMQQQEGTVHGFQTPKLKFKTETVSCYISKSQRLPTHDARALDATPGRALAATWALDVGRQTPANPTNPRGHGEHWIPRHRQKPNRNKNEKRRKKIAGKPDLV